MSAYDTAAFILFYLWIAAMILAFLWTARELWRMFVELANDEPHRPLEKGTGEQADDADLYPNVWRSGR